MPFTVDEIANINNASLETFLDKGKVHAQNIQDKPMLKAFQQRAGRFAGGNTSVSLAVKSGQGGGTLAGYTGDDQLSFYNPTGIKRAKWDWKEHHIGLKITMTELKEGGIDVVESGTDQSTRVMADSEMSRLANLIDEKNADLGEDFNDGLNNLIHQDGSSDSKALAGIGAFILKNPLAGSTGGLSRTVNAWWRNRAATTEYAAAGGQDKITSSASNGGALIEFLDKELRQLARYSGGSENLFRFAGSDYIDAYKRELRANGYYSMSMSTDSGQPDGSMKDPKHGGKDIIYDPWMDDNGMSKFEYVLDLGSKGIRLLYMDGQRMKRHNPARPYDRMVMYNGITTTAVMVARRLRSSAIYQIA